MMMVVVVMPVVAMMTMVPTMMAMPPSDFSGYRPGIFLHGRSRAGIAERQRVGPLGRRRDGEHCADGGKAQDFCQLHVWSPLVVIVSRPVTNGARQTIRNAATHFED